MEEFRQHLNQLYVISQELDHVDIKHFIQEIELIGRQLKYSQEFLFQEIQGLKQDLNRNSIKLNHANELREIDQNTLKTFKTKFQDLSQLLSDIRKKESNTYHLLQLLRVNTSRLWHIFETATGSTITQEVLYEDLQELYHQSQLENDEQTSKLILLEKEHGDLLLQLKDIQLSLENFRSTIFQIIQNTNQTKIQIQTQQQINDRLSEQISTKINQLIFTTKDIRLFLLDYKSLVQQINHLLKLIFHIQTEIEIHHKSILIYQMKFEKYKQDLTFSILHRTNCEDQISDLRKIIDRQNQNLERLNHQQIQILQNRRLLHQQVHQLEQDKTRIIDHQQQLLETIKQATVKNQSLEKQIFQSNQIFKNLNFSYRKLIHDQNKQQNITNQLHRTSPTVFYLIQSIFFFCLVQNNDHRLQFTKTEIDQFTEQINQQNRSIDSKEIQIESQMKEFDHLQTCFSATHEELFHQRTKVNESKIKVQTFTQKMRRLTVDEKPLIKEISHYQIQVIQNEINQKQLEMDFKQNETNIEHYKTIITKLIRDSKEDERIFSQENSLLKRYQDRTEKAKENLKILNKKNKYSENNYHDLKELSRQTENENRQLKQQYAELTFIVQLLGQRQVILSNQLKPLYEKIKRLTKRHFDQVKLIEQSKSDLDILHKYNLHLQSYSHQLHQSLSFTSQQHYEYLHSQSILNQFTYFQNHLQLEMKNNSNYIHYWPILMISSPEKFDKISKLLLIKKKLVHKSNELSQLKQFFHQKNTLYHYLNRISIRRQRLIEKKPLRTSLNF